MKLSWEIKSMLSVSYTEMNYEVLQERCLLPASILRGLVTQVKISQF